MNPPRRFYPLCFLTLLLMAGCAAVSDQDSKTIATYSIVALDPDSAEIGVAVQSKFFSVGSVVPWAEAGVGAVATQALANISFGPEGLSRMRKGESAQEALSSMLEADPGAERRQVGMIDANGNVAAHTGTECFPFAGHHIGTNYCVQGNILASPEVIGAMSLAFETSREAGLPLADCLTRALQAAEDAGGDRRGRQSAALLVVRENGGYNGANDRFIDLRVEDHPGPTEELSRLVQLHRGFFTDRHPVSSATDEQ